MEDLVAGINMLIAKDASPEIMVQYLQNYKNDDWKKYATWEPFRCLNHPYCIFIWLFRYTRNLVEEIEGKYSLILLCWPESNASAIHDHPNSDCIMKCLSGTVKETRFSWPEKKTTKMTETGYTVGTEGDVIHINGKCTTGPKSSANRQSSTVTRSESPIFGRRRWGRRLGELWRQ